VSYYREGGGGGPGAPGGDGGGAICFSAQLVISMVQIAPSTIMLNILFFIVLDIDITYKRQGPELFSEIQIRA